MRRIGVRCYSASIYCALFAEKQKQKSIIVSLSVSDIVQNLKFEKLCSVRSSVHKVKYGQNYLEHTRACAR